MKQHTGNRSDQQTGVQFETEGIFLSFKVSFSEKLRTENTCTGDASKDADIKYKKSKKCLSSEKNYDPYDAEEYDNADDFAEEFGDGDYDEGYDDAYDYWEERD